MTYDLAFILLHLVIAPCWFLLFFAPRAVWTERLVHSALMPALLGCIYMVLLCAGIFLGQANPDAGMESLPAVIALLSHPNGALTGWVHFLIYDLFVGAWIARDAARLGQSHRSTLPALAFALIFGPVGLLIHLARRALTTRAGTRLSEA
ncbi:MAG: ABA4-like family protein [Albidovulum sp.]|uniref:ABA4-like family protein n=1 Tax=Albidovulum sp. TaxID=1872424 RepID=UPI003C9DBA59